ncbi:MAG: hypothetical protein QOG13_861 [Sphingomonadales bacterium]|jgi:hypothetical protein|nr:hypothetical protein [Sphingomonadales bacterium]
MAEQVRTGAVLPFPAARAPGPAPDMGDLRFRTLIGEAAWARLPDATRARFGKRIAGCAAALYAGEVVECRINWAGWLLGRIGRLIGSPLPLCRDADVPACVSVTEDASSGGQNWTRIYGRRRGFPQVISSCKSFAGPTGLEELVGGGFGIALNVEVEGGALHFVSDHYFWKARGRRLRIPRWLAPGALRVSHVDCNHGLFAFVMALRHPWFGELIHQTAMFRDLALKA